MVLVVALGVIVLILNETGGSKGKPPAPTRTTATAAADAHLLARGQVPSIEAGVEPWTLPAALSREAVVADGSSLVVLGGYTASGSSLSGVATLNVANGQETQDASLAAPVHDAAAAMLGHRVFVFGGGSPNTVATVQSIPRPNASGSTGTGVVSGRLPTPRSDLAVVSVGAKNGGTAYIVGGYDGSSGEPAVLSTTDGTHFTQVARLAVPVRYGAVVATGGSIYVFGGELASPGSTGATSDIQQVNLSNGQTSIIGHLPQALYGAAAVVLGGTIYVAGGQVPGGVTLTQIDAFVPSTHRILHAGLLPQAVAFAGYATLGSGRHAAGYIVGGEVASQSGTDAAGMASGQLTSVLELRPSPYGGPAGPASAGAPFSGTLLIADRGNNRLLTISPSRKITWVYPTSKLPPPPGGFYFPDDAFFIHHGTAIISNQENNDTLVEIGYPSGKILWQYGHPGVPGSLPGYLFQPDDAYLLKSGLVTVADASNNRILFIQPSTNQIVHQIGNGVDAHVPGVSIAYPNGDTPLADGNVLVSEINGSWIDEYTPTGTMVWSHQFPTVNYPSDPQQLGPDLFLMCDYNPPGEGRILEFTKQGAIPWEYDVKSGDGMLKRPSLAERLPNGLIMVNDDHRDRVVAIDPTTKEIVWQYGLTDVPGTAPGFLSIPDGFDNLLANGTTPTHPVTG